MSALPHITTKEEWDKARAALLVKEKALTKQIDQVAAERRKLPMVQIDEKKYAFVGEHGEKKSLVDLFDGKKQLIVYHFMLYAGDPSICPGCSGMIDNIGRLEHLRARDANFVVTAAATQSQIQAVKKRMGWTVPFYEATPEWNHDCGVPDGPGISVFFKDDAGKVYCTYFATDREAERVRGDFNLLDMLPYGRSEDWEESPAGWPQTPPYVWWQLHDEYESDKKAAQ